MGHKLGCYKKQLENFKQNPDVVGVLLVGKGATTKEEDFERLNDVDLIILTVSGEKNRRSVEIIEGVDFDMSYLPVTFVEKGLETLNLLWIEILANGRIVYDQGITPLVERCKSLWKEGPAPLSNLKKQYWSFYLTSALEDIRNRLSTPALAKYLMMDFLNSMMQVVFKLDCRFQPLKKKRWLDLVKVLRPAIGKQIEEIILLTSVEEQFQCIEQLYQVIVSELGGPCPTWDHEEFPEE